MNYQLNPLFEVFGVVSAKQTLDNSKKIRKFADDNYGKAKWTTPLKNRKNFSKASKELKNRGELS